MAWIKLVDGPGFVTIRSEHNYICPHYVYVYNKNGIILTYKNEYNMEQIKGCNFTENKLTSYNEEEFSREEMHLVLRGHDWIGPAYDLMIPESIADLGEEYYEMKDEDDLPIGSVMLCQKIGLLNITAKIPVLSPQERCKFLQKRCGEEFREFNYMGFFSDIERAEETMKVIRTLKAEYDKAYQLLVSKTEQEYIEDAKNKVAEARQKKEDRKAKKERKERGYI